MHPQRNVNRLLILLWKISYDSIPYKSDARPGLWAALALRLVWVLFLVMVCVSFGSGSSPAASLPVGETG